LKLLHFFYQKEVQLEDKKAKWWLSQILSSKILEISLDCSKYIKSILSD